MSDDTGPDPLSPDERRAVLREHLERERDRRRAAEAKLAEIRAALTTSLTETGDELGFLERPADDSAMLDRALRLINRFLAVLGSEEGTGHA
jgi:hypothetical protein